MRDLPKDLHWLLFDLDGTLTDSAPGILSRMFSSTDLSVTNKGARCLNLSVTALTLWMLLTNTVLMLCVGSCQMDLHRVKMCVSLTKK